jgi:hypothetical protein
LSPAALIIGGNLGGHKGRNSCGVMGGGKVDKTQLTQVGRALCQLGITHIASYSPQGRGRMERVFGTLQKRLSQELRLARIRTMAGANRYPKERMT